MFRLPFGYGKLYNRRESVKTEIIMRDKNYGIDFGDKLLRLIADYKRLHIRKILDLVEKRIKVRIFR